MHAKRSPSGADRWAACPGSIAMSEGYEDGSSVYADYGTALHLIFADAITNGDKAEDYIGAQIEVGTIGEEFDGAIWRCIGVGEDFRPAPTGFKVRCAFNIRQEDVDIVGVAIENCRAMLVGSTYAETEAQVPIDHLTGETGATGSADVLAVREEQAGGSAWLRVLEVHDFKSGRNEVKPDCRQLKMYASGGRRLLDTMYGPFDKLRLVIHQPVVSDRPVVAEFLAEELNAFELEIQQAALLSRKAEETKAEWMGKSTEYLVPGLTDDDTQCKYCPASGKCPGQDAALTALIGLEFADMSATAAIPGWKDLDGVQLGRRLDAVPFVRAWAQAVEDRAYDTLLKGGEVAGHKLVQGRKGNRAWASEAEAEAEMKKMRLKQEVMYTWKIKSPTTMETELKATPSKWNRLARLVIQAEGKPTLAPLSDKRPAIKPPGAATAEDFEEIAPPPFAPEDLL